MTSKNSISWMVEHLIQDATLKQDDLPVHKVSKKEYEEFKHYYLFEALRDIKYGRAFCEYFGLSDFVLSYSKDCNFCQEMIEKYYVENETEIR